MNNNVKISQQAPYVNPGANPIPGVTANLPLNNVSSSVSADNNFEKVRGLVYTIYQNIITGQNVTSFSPVLQQVIQDTSDETLAEMLKQLMYAMQFNLRTQSKPVNNSLSLADPTNVAKKIFDYIDKMEQYNNSNTQQPQPQVAPAPVAPNPAQPMTAQPIPAQNMVQTAQIIQKKKKTRGNPFRVLMGKVGKLLDHGLNKSQIIKSLSKQKYWNHDTIEKAVDLVKDYNKKKYKESMSEIKRLITAEAKEFENLQINYEILSTPDLIMRQSFLQACVDGVDLGASPPTPKKELTVINKILKERATTL